MKKKILIAFLTFFTASTSIAQQIPFGSCGIVYIYDAAGNRTKRIYFCNNGGSYPGFAQTSFQTPSAKDDVNTTVEFQQVDALYPNPTSGIFYITFSKVLSQAPITITDINGKVVQQIIGSGEKIKFDLSVFSSGTYFVRLLDNGKNIVKKIIKE
jgi:hypothetical protein